MQRKPYPIVLAYDTDGEPEITHQLYPHTGDEGQAADLRIFAFADGISEDADMSIILSMPEYREVACLTLDIELGGEIYNALSGPELFLAFMKALKYRIAPLQQKDFLEASKK